MKELTKEEMVSKIYLVRNQKVMLDSDLAELYEVETKRINEQVRRNIERFPEDFMFQLTDLEWDDLRSQIATANPKMRRFPPYVFTEHGILMLSSVLKSKKAVEVNIKIMRVYKEMKDMILSNKELIEKMNELEKMVSGQDEKIVKLFNFVQAFMRSPGDVGKIGY